MYLDQDLSNLIAERKEIAYKRVKNNPLYRDLCSQRNKNDEETEVYKLSLEADEIYIQGLRDAFGLLALLAT
jgi:hypothetical protein